MSFTLSVFLDKVLTSDLTTKQSTNLNSSVISELRKFELSEFTNQTNLEETIDRKFSDKESQDPKKKPEKVKKRREVENTFDMSIVSEYGEGLDPDDSMMTTMSRKDIVRT